MAGNCMRCRNVLTKYGACLNCGYDKEPTQAEIHAAYAAHAAAQKPKRESQPDTPQPESVMQEANRLINGDRLESYGHPLDSHIRIGQFWGIILNSDPIPPETVALMMCTLKISRELSQPKRDNRVDIAGFAGCVQDIMDERARRAKEVS